MSMIKGKIETDREVAPRRIIASENSPFRRVGDRWTHSTNATTVVTVRDAQSVASALGRRRR